MKGTPTSAKTVPRKNVQQQTLNIVIFNKYIFTRETELFKNLFDFFLIMGDNTCISFLWHWMKVKCVLET